MKQENNTGGKGTGRGEEGEQQLHFQSGSLHCQGGEDTGEFTEAFQAGVFMSYGVRVCVGTTAADLLAAALAFRDARSEIERPHA